MQIIKQEIFLNKQEILISKEHRQNKFNILDYLTKFRAIIPWTEITIAAKKTPFFLALKFIDSVFITSEIKDFFCINEVIFSFLKFQASAVLIYSLVSRESCSLQELMEEKK